MNEPAPFDHILIDADKPNNPHSLYWAPRYSRIGILIIGDNVVLNGEVINPYSQDVDPQDVRPFNKMMGIDPWLNATVSKWVVLRSERTNADYSLLTF